MDQQFDQNNAVFRSRKPVKFLDFNQISQKIVQNHASSSNGFGAKIQKPEPKKITTIENCVIPDDLVFSSDTNSSQKFSTPLPKARKKLRNQRGEVVQINNNQSSEGGAHFADYHKFTWGVSPESSIASGSGQQALRKVIICSLGVCVGFQKFIGQFSNTREILNSTKNRENFESS